MSQDTFTEPVFRYDIDCEGFDLSDRERDLVDGEVNRLQPLVEEFPTQILHVNLEYNQNSEEYETRLALVLPGQTFATGRTSPSWTEGLEIAMQKMIRRVEHYKQDLEGIKERSHLAAGTDQLVEPSWQIDGQKVRQAVANGNFAAFRSEMYAIDGSLRDRIGRWVQRYPRVDALIGDRILLADIVEDVLMTAFDDFDKWNPEMTFGQWLETLIDPVVKQFARDPDGELEAIAYQRTWMDASPDAS